MNSNALRIGPCSLELIQGDITTVSVDAVVNAANRSLMGGGGVDGAIHRAGGPDILKECKQIVSRIGSLPTGKAVITTAGKLPAKYVVHTVGPIWKGGTANESSLLAGCYRESLQLAGQHKLTTVAFPSISTGIYGYPLEKAAPVALQTVHDYLARHKEPERVLFILFDSRTLHAYKEALLKLPGADVLG